MTQFISTTIPYVNGEPHIGHAQEFVLADVLRRFYGDVYFHSGTDENSLKNVLAAESVGIDTATFVAERSASFKQLTKSLGLALTDFIQTSSDVRHRPVVNDIWERCEQQGDIYSADYNGLYCVGCEQFYAYDELPDGKCPEHGTKPEQVSERNYFFRLTRYKEQLIKLISTGAINITPVSRRNEVLGFLNNLNQDLSISRSASRARGWGIPVPYDNSQVVYVWFDALLNYVSGPGINKWESFDNITHVVGKGVLRFHAVYWPAILISAGLRLPNKIFVHNYVTVEGKKIGKSLGNAIAPSEPIHNRGLDAFRYFLIRHIGCYKDGDFSWERFHEAYTQELANQLGNLVSRLTKLSLKHDSLPEPEKLLASTLNQSVTTEVDRFALHKALEHIWKVIDNTNAFISEKQPWKLSHEDQATVLATAVNSLEAIASELQPFLPETSEKIHLALHGLYGDKLFPRLE